MLISFDLLLIEAFILLVVVHYSNRRETFVVRYRRIRTDSRIKNISTAPQALFAIEKGLIFEVSFKVCIGFRFPEFFLRMLISLQ